jgi:DNA repair protein RadC
MALVTSSFTVNDLPVSERPRERLVRHGSKVLSAQELLALILGRGTRGQSVMNIAQELLVKFSSLEKVVEASLEDLCTIKGLGLAKATQLKACLEIAQRVANAQLDGAQAHGRKQPVASPQDIFAVVRPLIASSHKEHLVLISFDNRNKVLATDMVAVGTLNANLVHPREVFDLAISHHAASIAISHNHPSGDAQPSEADVAVTKRLKEAGVIMGIELLDHVIITTTTFFSFRENQLM